MLKPCFSNVRLMAAALLFITAVPLWAGEPALRSAADSIQFAPADWPWWRGPNRNGVAVDQRPPLKWSETENVLWKAPIPGRGHGSPIVVGDQVFLATAEPGTLAQSVLCIDRHAGKLLWQTEVHRGGLEQKGNAKSSLASSTAACDGQRVFINFLHDGAIYTTALDRAGKILWQTRVSDYTLHQGFGSSPMPYQGLVLVSADNKGRGVIAGLERATGKIVWKQERPQLPNYASPIVHNLGGRDQLFMIGCDLVASFDPLTGQKLWETKGSTTECVTSVVTDGEHIFTSGGFPKQHVSAVRADGSAKLAWESKNKVYVPSMLVHQGHLYAVMDAGLAVCWKCATGQEVWKERLGGEFTASPTLIGDNIFATNEAGRTFVFKATPKGLNVIAENLLGQEALATPTYCGNRIYLRLAVTSSGKRQEMLYCVGAN